MILRQTKNFILMGLTSTLSFFSSSSWADTPGEKETPKPQEVSKNTSARPAGHVLTYYGLRKLEHDANVSEVEKLKEWEDYIVRTRKYLDYAKKAVNRWKTAARQRVLENVRKNDSDPKLRPGEKMARWQRILNLYPKSKEARLAKKRISFWRIAETKILVEAANDVEKRGDSKVDRIGAWQKVVRWTKEGPEAKAARKRIQTLQKQLYQEAQSLDRIARVDAKTKLASWKDVLAGEPSKAQRRIAKKRIKELEASK